MTDSEQNAVNQLKMMLVRLVIDLDDEKILKIIKASLKGYSND